MFKPKKLAALVVLALALPCQAEEATASPDLYQDADTRLGVGYGNESKLRLEAQRILGESALSAWLANAWLADRSGGLQLDYHWLPEEVKPGQLVMPWVRKVFMAYDRAKFGHAKVSIGGGLEQDGTFFGLYGSMAASNRRETGMQSNSRMDTQRYSEGGRDFLRDVTTTTTDRWYEQAYDHGLGLRASTFSNQYLIRLTGGLDHEWADKRTYQTAFSLAMEKYFAGSPHSLALAAELYRKHGEYDDESNRHRVSLTYRYTFGDKGYKPPVNRRSEPQNKAEAGTAGSTTPGTADQPATPGSQSSQQGSDTAQPRTEKRMVKTTASMSTDAFFEFDKARLTKDATTALDSVIATLKANGFTGNIHISGHTCDIGAAKYNRALSGRRAEAVQKYLAEKGGINLNVLVAEGMGEENPRFPNNKEGRPKNRRVDLEFVSFKEGVEEVVIVPPSTAGQTSTSATSGSPAVAGTAAGSNAGKPAATISWQKEVIEVEPAWVRRAMRQAVPHKETVDVYRSREREVSVSNGTSRPVNRGPVAVADQFSVGGTEEVTLDVLANDSDPDGDTIKLIAVSSPQNGSVRIEGNKLLYSAKAGFAGTDTFNYRISDGKGGEAEASVSVKVSLNKNRPPVAVDDYVTPSNDKRYTFYVRANDSDPDYDELKVISVTQPAHGTVSIAPDGDVYYQAEADFWNYDSFTYTVSDGKGGTATATVRMYVHPRKPSWSWWGSDY